MKAAGRSSAAIRQPGHAVLQGGNAGREGTGLLRPGHPLAFGFNHAEAQRAFQAAQKADPKLAMACWGEALVLGPNINAPMMPEAVEPALAALAKAEELAPGAPAKDQALIAALAEALLGGPEGRARRRSTRPTPTRCRPWPGNIRPTTPSHALRGAVMDTQPWDYWEDGGTKPRADAPSCSRALETVLARNPDHPGATTSTSTRSRRPRSPSRALPHARRLAALMPGAGHIVHMPAHIYYRIGMYKDSLEINKRAMSVDEQYFGTSPSDPLYRSAYYPHNIHFVLVSAQMGGDGPTAIEAAGKLDASLSDDVDRAVRGAGTDQGRAYLAHALFSAPDEILALKAPPREQVLVYALSHYARALAFAAKKDDAEHSRDRRHRRRSSRRPTSSRTPTGQCRARRSCRPRAWSRARASPTRKATSRGSEGLRGGDRYRRHARLHGAALLVLPDPPVPGLGPPAAGQTR